MKKIIFTTSWDDGDKLDSKIADLLDKYGLKGTFYVPKKFPNRMSDDEIRELAKRHEIGGHTSSHAFLQEIKLSEVEKEITNGKSWLENILAEPIKMFSYPKGQYNNEIKEKVIQAGFIGARTVENGDKIDDVFAMPVTVQIYPFPFRRRSARKIHWSKFLFEPLLSRGGIGLKNRFPLKSFLNWNNFVIAYFNHTIKNGEFFHLWGHSYEVEKYNMWEDLEKFFEYVKSKSNIDFVTNSELVERFRK